MDPVGTLSTVPDGGTCQRSAIFKRRFGMTESVRKMLQVAQEQLKQALESGSMQTKDEHIDARSEWCLLRWKTVQRRGLM